LANALVKPEDLGKSEARYPLKLAFCPFCTLVQITETVAPEVLFGEYLYFSSFSDTMLKHAAELAARRECAAEIEGDPRALGGIPVRPCSSSAVAMLVNTLSPRKIVARCRSSLGTCDWMPGFHGPQTGDSSARISRLAMRTIIPKPRMEVGGSKLRRNSLSGDAACDAFATRSDIQMRQNMPLSKYIRSERAKR